MTAPKSNATVGTSGGTFAVSVTDVAGIAIAGQAVSFFGTGGVTVSPASGVTDAAGLASTQVSLGTVAGTVSVSASAVGISLPATSTFTSIAAATSKIVVTPKTLRLIFVGDTARVTATAEDQFGNLAGANAISFVSLDPTLVSVDATGLVRVLRQGGTAFIVSASSGKADTTTVTVLPPGSTNCTGLVGVTTMAVGDVQTFAGVQYACVPGSTAGAEYTVVAFNSSTDQTNAFSTSVKGNGLGVAPSAFTAPLGAPLLRSLSGSRPTAPLEMDERFHLALLARAKAEHPSFATARAARRMQVTRSITGTGGTAINAAIIPATAKVGDLVTLNVSANSCASPTNRPVRVAAIGTKSIVLADTLNPVGGFTDTDYQRISARFDTLVYPLDVGAFGAPSDIDNNGRVALIFTRTVNELVDSTSGYFVGGFFNPRDLFPKVATVAADNCAGSNEGEMFYLLVPAPDGINGVKHSAGFVDSVTTGIIAHEFQHLINGSRRFINPAADNFEDVWLNEGLSHVAEELLYYHESGFTPRQNLNDSTIRILNRPLYGFFKNDGAANLSRLLAYLKAPSANSPYANNDDLATRGATWSFLRYAADRLGTTDGTIWQRFDDATTTGLATLQLVLGQDPVPLVKDWTVANYVDDLGVSSDPRYMHKSWNYRNILTTTFLNNPTYPLAVTGLADGATSNFAIRGGSAAYARFSVLAGREGLLTFSSGGGAPVTPMQFVVVRTK